MICTTTGHEVEPECPREGVLRCPECGAELDEETLDPVTPEADSGAWYYQTEPCQHGVDCNQDVCEDCRELGF